jgi:pyridoxamine 5'-phosphate oxidase
MKQSIEKLRQEYCNRALEEDMLSKDPFIQFTRWLNVAIKSKELDPNSMTLSTVSPLGHPSSRNVLLKKVDEKGLVFFTNYDSRKAEQIKANPHAALAFLWKITSRQILVEGKLKKVTRKEVEEYFKSRPRGAQIAAHASKQSAPLASRLELESAFREIQQRYRGKKIPCPPTWGGYRLIPHRFEFWQGRKDRMHDRFLYVLVNNQWIISRLSP